MNNFHFEGSESCDGQAVHGAEGQRGEARPRGQQRGLGQPCPQEQVNHCRPLSWTAQVKGQLFDFVATD